MLVLYIIFFVSDCKKILNLDNYKNVGYIVYYIYL